MCFVLLVCFSGYIFCQVQLFLNDKIIGKSGNARTILLYIDGSPFCRTNFPERRFLRIEAHPAPTTRYLPM